MGENEIQNKCSGSGTDPQFEWPGSGGFNAHCPACSVVRRTNGDVIPDHETGGEEPKLEALPMETIER